jgi:hypothetical protein
MSSPSGPQFTAAPFPARAWFRGRFDRVQAFAWLLIAWDLPRVLGGDLSGLRLAAIGWVLNDAAQQTYQQLVPRRALQGVRVAEVMTRQVPSVLPELSLEKFVNE